MKGLLLKDWYMTVKYCKAFLLIVAVFGAVLAFSGNNTFYAFYAGIMSGMVPVTLLSYDERSKWTVYSCALPYTRAQLVSVKYIIGGCGILAVLIFMSVVQGVKMGLGGTFTPGGLLGFASMQLFMSCLVISINMPFVFKWGVEKGRIAYYITIILGFVFVGFIGGILMMTSLTNNFNFGLLTPAFMIAGVGIYALSWRLSVRFYEKREL